MRETKLSPSEIRPSRERAWLVGFLAFAAVTRIAYFLFYRASDPLASYLLHDAKRYHEWAQALSRGETWEAGAFYQAPLYPYLVSLVYRVFGPDPTAIYVLQLVSGIVVLFLVHRIAKRVYGSRAALHACALGSGYAPFVFYETKLLPAALSVLLATVALDRVLLARERHRASAWIAPGVAIGAGALANPGALVFGALVGGWLCFERAASGRARAARVAVLIASAAAIVLPVTVRNYRAAGEPVLISTNGGITFYQGNNPAAKGVFSTPDGFTGSIFSQREESRRVAEAESVRTLTDSEVSGFFARKGLGYWTSEPGAALVLLGRKLVLLVGAREQPLEYNVALDENPARFVLVIPFALLVGLACARVHSGGRRPLEAPVLLLLLSQAAVLLVFYVSGRYRLPAVPALLAVAGQGTLALQDRSRSGPLVTAFIVTLVSVFAASLAAPGLASQQDAVSYCDRAEAYFKTGKPNEAATLYRRAAGLDPTYPYAHLDLGKTLVATGDLAGAEAAFRKAVATSPELAEAHLDLGALLYGQGRPAEAADAFAEASRRDPRNADAANNLLGTLLALGRNEAALAAWRDMRSRGLRVDPPLERRLRDMERAESIR